MVEEVKNIIERELTKEEKEWKEIHEPNIEKAAKSIKHPHFKYARYNLVTQEITYHWKNILYWFSGERVVSVTAKVRKAK